MSLDVRGVIIPAYKAERTLGKLLAEVMTRVEPHRILVVDDGSPDRTAQVARDAGVEVVKLARNGGKGGALAAGLARATELDWQWAVTMDADGQHHPGDLPQFLAYTAAEMAGVVVGARRLHPDSMPWPRVISNRMTTALLSWQAGQPLWDSQCGYRMYRCEAIREAGLPPQGRFEWESEALVRLSHAGWSVELVRIATVYGDEVSHIRPWRDTWRFIQLWFRMWWVRHHLLRQKKTRRTTSR